MQKIEEDRARKRRKEGPRQRRKSRASLRQFLHEVRQELKKVAWPTPHETFTFSVVVLIVTVAVTGVVFGMDFVFKAGVLRMLDAT